MKHISSTGTMVGGASYQRPKPSFSVTDTDLPAIKSWEVGKKYTLSIEVEMVRHSQGDEYSMENSKKHEARLKIVSFKK